MAMRLSTLAAAAHASKTTFNAEDIQYDLSFLLVGAGEDDKPGIRIQPYVTLGKHQDKNKIAKLSNCDITLTVPSDEPDLEPTTFEISSKSDTENLDKVGEISKELGSQIQNVLTATNYDGIKILIDGCDGVSQGEATVVYFPLTFHDETSSHWPYNYCQTGWDCYAGSEKTTKKVGVCQNGFCDFPLKQKTINSDAPMFPTTGSFLESCRNLVWFDQDGSILQADCDAKDEDGSPITRTTEIDLNDCECTGTVCKEICNLNSLMWCGRACEESPEILQGLSWGNWMETCTRAYLDDDDNVVTATCKRNGAEKSLENQFNFDGCNAGAEICNVDGLLKCGAPKLAESRNLRGLSNDDDLNPCAEENYTESYLIPNGSFKDTCINEFQNNNTFYSDCQKADRTTWIRSSVVWDDAFKSGNVCNNDGALVLQGDDDSCVEIPDQDKSLGEVLAEEAQEEAEALRV